MKKIALLAVMLLLTISVLQCSGGEGGGTASPDPGPVDPPGPSYLISGTITSPSGWGDIIVFDVNHSGTRDAGGSSVGAQAMYPCDNVTCDCVGTCTYQISEYDGSYVVTVRVAPIYGDYVSTPLSRTVVVAGADVTGQDFEVNLVP